jgi:hypothetical protein
MDLNLRHRRAAKLSGDAHLSRLTPDAVQNVTRNP